MSFINRIVSKAQRYAQQNPDKVRGYTDKAARFADKRTKGKYRSQIDNAVRKVDGLAGGDRPSGGSHPGGSQHGGSQHGGPDPRRDDRQDPYRDDPRR